MKKLFLLFLVLTSFQHGGHAQEVKTRFILTSAKVDIRGTTNVNKFNCSLREPDLSDTLYIAGEWEGNAVVLDGLDLRLAVKKFDCGLNLMTNDFRKIMMSETYPHVLLTIDKLTITSDVLKDSTYNLSSIAHFSIGKETRRQNIKDGSLKQKNSKQIITGSHSVKMTSFGLTPPSKFLGTVNVRDELVLGFELVLEKR